ncbi:MAG: fumarylacetoacetate hydrolase family protein [Prevotella sp.]|nr:fumarylacetoacetate hydrolase family protein [Selenomonas sp.]MCR5644595.1 fumarylacetoacetate hydrolase family protein [Prevotella sp.]
MKIIGIGKNYALHNQEMEGEAYKPKAPVVFLKPDSALQKPGKPFFVPDDLGRIDYETELVIRICRLGKNIAERFAYRYYDAVTVGLDFTARDLQQQAKEAGLPWTISKGFDSSAVIGEWVEPSSRMLFHLEKNGVKVQEGCSDDMLYRIDELISYVSHFFTMKTGDLIFTGTPAGVGPVSIGDHLTGWIDTNGVSRQVLDVRCK